MAEIDTLLQTLDECHKSLLRTPGASRRTQHIERIKEITRAVCDDQARLPEEGRVSTRGGDHKFNAQILLARIISEYTRELIAKVDAEGSFLYTNASHLETLGYRQFHLMRTNIIDLAADGHKASVKEHLQRALTQGHALDTLCLRHSAGTICWIESSAMRMKVAGTYQLVLIGRDVTARKLAEDALRASEARHRAVLRAIPDLLLQVNANGLILEQAATSRAETAAGAERWIGRRIQDVVPTVGPALLEQITTTLETDRPQVQEYRFCWPQIAEADYEARAVVSAPGEVLVMWRDITERKRAERAEHESRERYRQMFEETGAVVLLVDQATRQIVDANPAAISFYGYARTVLTSMTLDQITVLARHRLDRTLQWFVNGEHTFFMYKHRVAAGTVFNVEMHASPIEIHGQRLLYCIVQDVTDRIREENARRMSEMHLEIMAEHQPAIVWTVDQDLVVSSISGSGMQGTELSSTATVGLSLRERFKARPDHPILVGHNRALEGEASSYELVSNQRRFRSYVAPSRDSTGTIIGCMGVSYDITERVQLEQAIQASEQKYRLLVEQCRDAIIVVLPDQEHITVNAAAVELLGYTSDECARLCLSDLLLATTLDPDARSAHATTWHEGRLRHKDGHMIHVHVSAWSIVDGSSLIMIRPGAAGLVDPPWNAS